MREKKRLENVLPQRQISSGVETTFPHILNWLGKGKTSTVNYGVKSTVYGNS